MRPFSTSLIILMITFFTSFQYLHSAEKKAKKKAEKMRIAVQTLQAKGVSSVTAGAVTDLVKTYIVNTNHFDVIEREQIDQILNEIGFQQTGCTDNSCAVKVGKLLSAKKMLLGDIKLLDKAYIISIRIVDVESGKVESASSIKTDSESKLDAAALKLAKNLVDRIMRGNKGFFEALWLDITSDSRNYTGYYFRSVVPGWGQYYSGNQSRGYMFMGLAAAAFAFTGYSYYDYSVKKNDYNDLTRADPPVEFDDRAKKADDAAKIVNISLVVLLTVYVVNWVDVIWFNDMQPDTAGIMRNESGFYAGIWGSRKIGVINERYFDVNYTYRF